MNFILYKLAVVNRSTDKFLYSINITLLFKDKSKLENYITYLSLFTGRKLIPRIYETDLSLGEYQIYQEHWKHLNDYQLLDKLKSKVTNPKLKSMLHTKSMSAYHKEEHLANIL